MCHSERRVAAEESRRGVVLHGQPMPFADTTSIRDPMRDGALTRRNGVGSRGTPPTVSDAKPTTTAGWKPALPGESPKQAYAQAG